MFCVSGLGGLLFFPFCGGNGRPNNVLDRDRVAHVTALSEGPKSSTHRTIVVVSRLAPAVVSDIGERRDGTNDKWR